MFAFLSTFLSFKPDTENNTDFEDYALLKITETQCRVCQ